MMRFCVGQRVKVNEPGTLEWKGIIGNSCITFEGEEEYLVCPRPSTKAPQAGRWCMCAWLRHAPEDGGAEVFS